MRCISPLFIRSSSSREFVPCGKCNFCLSVKREEWTFRLLQEAKQSKTAAFLTLTYEDGTVPTTSDGLLDLRKRDLQLFQKRLRKENAKFVPWPVRYYSVGEYGTRTERPHYHSIMFNVCKDVSARYSDIWSAGMVRVGDVNVASIHYVTKYVINRIGDYGGREPPFSLMSKRPGIGSSYLWTHAEWHLDERRNYTNVNGKIGRLPRYYKDYFYTSYERGEMRREALQLGDNSYRKEVQRLTKFHIDAEHYYDERVVHDHEGIKSKCNNLNRF